MRSYLLQLFVLLALFVPKTTGAAEPKFDETTRFIFYSVLEGLYDDGVSTEDVEQILMRNEGEEYFHFIYACPVCMASVWALNAYKNRPEHLHSVKGGESTFGEGLDRRIRDELHHDDPKRRLAAINGLIKRWIAIRIERMNLSDEARNALQKRLEKKREDGMELLKKFHSSDQPKGVGAAYYAPAYATDKTLECAACNAAVGKAMDFTEKKER